MNCGYDRYWKFADWKVPEVASTWASSSLLETQEIAWADGLFWNLWVNFLCLWGLLNEEFDLGNPSEIEAFLRVPHIETHKHITISNTVLILQAQFDSQGAVSGEWRSCTDVSEGNENSDASCY